jgi:DNA uptake protein ComE-like DNA-binding protein
MNYKAWLRHYFGFTTKESKGFLMLMGVLGFVLALPTLYDVFQPAPQPIKVLVEELKADSALQILETKQVSKKSNSSLFAFNPNSATENDFVQLGLPIFLAKRIINYRTKGGKFRKATDFAKIYGLGGTDFQRLLPYILLDEIEQKEYPKTSYEKKVYTPTTAKVIDLNVADTSDLKRINGIGSVLALRIIKYRSKLGGFANEAQLFEVYGLDSSVAKLALSKLFLNNKNLIKQIAINQISSDSLAKHPYIGRKAAKILTNYRNQHGAYLSKEDILKSKALESDKVERLIPYLKF